MAKVARSGALSCLILGLVGCDHATKQAAKLTLENGDVVPVVEGVLNLRYAENHDIAFNLLSWLPEALRSVLLLGTGALAIMALSVLVFRARSGPKWRVVAISAVLAGAVGNYADRVLRGYVVDFVHLTHWPVFNVADVCITLGALALIFMGSRTKTASASQA